MAFEYGSSSLGIENPFKTEGKISIISGVLISLIGVYLLLNVSSDLKVNHILGWRDVIFGLTILLWGITVCATGILKVSKFFVGRNAPASLAKNENPSENYAEWCTYGKMDLESMFTSRKNITFSEPSNLVQRVLYSILPDLLFTPPPVYNFLFRMSTAFTKIVIGLFIYGILYFIITVGLLGDVGSRFTSMLSFALLTYLVFILIDVARFAESKIMHGIKRSIVSGLVIISALALFKSTGNAEDIVEPLNFNAWTSLIIFFILVALVITFAIALIRQRGYGQTVTEVSEHRENLQESIHPNEVMIHLEKIILANRRHKELPNRVYQKFEPALHGENITKGSFEGKTMIETQPEFIETEYEGKFIKLRLIGTVASHALIVISAILFVLLCNTITVGNFADTFSKFYTILFSALIVYGSGTILQKFTHILWSELRFKSLLLWMKMDGTFTESKVSTGMSVYDSTRSENTLVRSSITNWIICSKVITSTFTEAGRDNVEGYRYILEMQKDDNELNAVLSELKDFLASRSNIAGISKTDMENTSAINDINKESGVFQTGYLKIEGIHPTSLANHNNNSGLIEG